MVQKHLTDEFYSIKQKQDSPQLPVELDETITYVCGHCGGAMRRDPPMAVDAGINVLYSCRNRNCGDPRAAVGGSTKKLRIDKDGNVESVLTKGKPISTRTNNVYYDERVDAFVSNNDKIFSIDEWGEPEN